MQGNLTILVSDLHTCFQYEGIKDKKWCSTATWLDGTHVTGAQAYGECPEPCTGSCSASTGPAAGQPCVFPFVWQGHVYDSCQPWVWGGEGEGQLWCSTKVRRQI